MPTELTDLKDTFYAKEVQSFLQSFVVSPEDVASGKAPATAPKSEKEVLKDVQGIWKEKGFLTPAELRNELVHKYIPNADPKLLGVMSDIEGTRYQPDAMTGYLQKQHLGVVSGLSHLYAQTTGGKIAMVEVDYSNMGGTNEVAKAWLAKERGVDPSAIDQKDAFKFTDDSARLIAKSIQKDLTDTAPNGAKVMAVRAGGDELRLIVTDIDPKDYKTVAQKIHDSIEAHTASLDLHDHPHLKGADNPIKNGFGAAVTMVDLNHIDPATVIEHADEKIKAEKNKIGHARLGIIDEAATTTRYETYFAKHPEAIPAGMTAQEAVASALEKEKARAQDTKAALEEKKQATAGNLDAKQKYIEQSIERIGIDEHATLGTKSPSYLQDPAKYELANLFATPAEHRAALVADEMKKQGLTVDKGSELYLQRTIENTTPKDPSAGTWMPTDMPETLEIFSRDTERVKSTLLAQGADPGQVAELKPHVMGTAFHNLGGLNDALGHDGANIVLKHMAQGIVTNAMEKNGLKPGDFQTAHYGGAEFQTLIAPVTKTPDGHYKPIAPKTFENIQKDIQASVADLNKQNVVEFLERNGLPPSPEMREKLKDMTFADIKDIKPDRGISGMHAVTHDSAVTLSGPGARAGEALYQQRQALESDVNQFRADLTQQKQQQQTPQPETQPPAQPPAEQLAQGAGEHGTPPPTPETHATHLPEAENLTDAISSTGKRSGLVGGVVMGTVAATVTMASTGNTAEAAQTFYETAVPYGETQIKAAEGDLKGATKAAMVETASNAGSVGGAAGGAVTGAWLGTAVFPGIGTGLGALIGAGIGGFGGGWLAGEAAEQTIEVAEKLTEDTSRKSYASTLDNTKPPEQTLSHTFNKEATAPSNQPQPDQQISLSPVEAERTRTGASMKPG